MPLTDAELAQLRALVDALDRELKAIEARYKAERGDVEAGRPHARVGTRIA